MGGLGGPRRGDGEIRNPGRSQAGEQAEKEGVLGSRAFPPVASGTSAHQRVPASVGLPLPEHLEVTGYKSHPELGPSPAVAAVNGVSEQRNLSMSDILLFKCHLRR